MLWILAVLHGVTTPAVAQESTEPAPTTAEADDEGSRLGVNARYRNLFLPRGLLNPWYNDTQDWTGTYASLERPSIGAQVFGLEFAIEPRPASFLIYAEYWKVNWEPGYWDDKDSGAQEQTDGDWLAPNGLGLVAMGVDFGHEFEVTDPSADVWLGFRLGGGLGIGVLTGSVDQWHPGGDFSTEPTNNCEPGLFAVDRAKVCEPDETLALPPVAPLLDLDLAWRIHFMDTGVLRIDAGLHSMFYVGAAAGAVF